MQRACLLASSAEINAQDLGLPVQASSVASQPDSELDRESIELALQNANGVIAQAAQELGLSRQALYRRMDRLGIAR